MKRRAPAREAARWHADGDLWIDHAIVVDSDATWMYDVTRLTLWNVILPERFLSHLPLLWWVDVRGGSREGADLVTGCTQLQSVALNQIRGLRDLTALQGLASLRCLSLYGLPRVERLP